MKKLLLLFLSLAPVLSFSQELSADLQEQIRQAQKEFQIPAIGVSLITTDSIFSYVNGKAKLGKKEKISTDAKFHLGSNTKAITAFMAVHLIEEGKLEFETPFFQLFPELQANAQAEYHQITLGDLLSHQAFIPPYTKGIELAKFRNLKGSASENRYAFAQSILKDKPVKKGEYSNAGYVLAALMLEKASGKTYRQLLEETMDDLNLDWFVGFPNKEKPENPWGHWFEGGSLTALEPGHDYKLPNFMSSAGDVAMNLADYSKFVQLNLDGLTGKSNYLKGENYKLLHFGQSAYAYGWGNANDNGNRISYHDGSAGTYYCHTFINTDEELAVVIVANTATPEAVKAIYNLRKWILNHPQESKEP